MAKALKKEKDYSSFKSFFYLTLLQIKDKMKFSLRKPDGKFDTKTIIQKMVFFILKFALIAGGVALICFFINFLGIIAKTEFVNLYIIFYFVFVTLALISNTVQLMRDLYYSDDNKVLVTMPVSSSQLFLSKIIVFAINDFIKAFEILVPVTLGFAIITCSIDQISLGSIFWSFIPLFITNGVLVLLAAFLSIPALYIYKFFKTYPITELIGLILLTGIGITVVILLISLIPEDIDLINQWPAMRNTLQNAINDFIKYIYPFAFVVNTMFGSRNESLVFRLTGENFAHFGILVGILALLVLIAYFVIKPFYFNMMTKTFEFDKIAVLAPKKNVKHKKYVTFSNKEFKLSFRDVDISGSYLVVYIITPILLYFIDTVFSAINTRLEGDIMTFSFNILLIVLPYLASNSMIATMYSKEGRTAYLKKTKPIDAMVPLTSKLLFNLVFSVPSIIGCAVVFGNFANIGVFPPIAVAVSVLLIQYGHIFFCATRDIMNPQNEVYATNGEQLSNPNERVATIVAFVLSFAVAGLTWFFLLEANGKYGDLTWAFIRLTIMSVLIFGSFLALYILYVKAYYYEK